MQNNSDVLNIKFKVCDSVKYKIDENNIVTVFEEQNHVIQRIFRKFKFKIPMYKKIVFDEYSSEVFLQIDGIKTVEEIGIALEERFGNRVYPLYERLLIFLNYIYRDCKYIDKIK